jgi:hypothetical protein
MDRRTFIQLSAVGAAAISLPQLHCKPTPEGLLEFPTTLSTICDEKTIKQIGSEYLHTFPEENKPSRLRRQLLRDTNGKEIASTTDVDILTLHLQKKIHEDFRTSHTVILKGWVLSLTEARQCALFSLTGA